MSSRNQHRPTVSLSPSRILSLGISPCPNDTYIFHALAKGCIDLPCGFDLFMADVEVLNGRAREGSLEVTKLSLAAMVHVLDDYVLLNAGAALGRGCGPLLVAREPLSPADLAGARVAIPGRMTTANLLLSLHGALHGPREEMVFDQVMPAVAAGKADCGLVIHEGRFTYGGYGLHCVLDLGQWWESAYGLPLPLGAIAARRDLGGDAILAVQDAIRRSLEYANANPAASRGWIREHAQEMSDEVTDSHIRTFVNDFSLDLRDEGRAAIRALLEKAAAMSGQSGQSGQSCQSCQSGQSGRGLPALPLFA